MRRKEKNLRLQKNRQKDQKVTVQKHQTNLTSLSQLATDALIKGSLSFDDWNFNDDEGTKSAKEAEDKSQLSLDSTKTTVTMISSPQGGEIPAKQPSSSAILIMFNLIVQSFNTMQNHPRRKQLTNWELLILTSAHMFVTFT